MNNDTIRVLVVDDHPLYLDGLTTLLNRPPTSVVVGAARNGDDAVAKASELIPDVVVMDLQLPDLHGIEATRRVTSANPSIGVLVLTMFEDDDLVFAAMRAGARGYLLKGADHVDIAQAVTVVARGDVIFGAPVAERLLGFFTEHRTATPAAFPELSPREREVLDFIAAGLNNDTIARRLGLSPKTVRNHISNIFVKLHVTDRAEAIVRARRAGLGDTPDAGG